ncbi:MAG TPA: Fic family protein [Solirubrobacterales bacterium]|nr:Fic family protein [Solirubrobacterales bacterium]
MEALGRHEKHFWPSEPEAYGSARRGGTYRAFVPAPIGEMSFSFTDQAAHALSAAATALARLGEDPPRLSRLGSIAQNLLRSESVASSRIEGVAISHKRLARAEYQGSRRGDAKAAEVLGNVEAMRRAIALGAEGRPFTVEDVLEIHRTLLRHDERGIAGVVRDKQNWIGGNDYNPVGATYVPPPPAYVPALLEDLCRFVERRDLPPVAQAAIVHAQFENIHPFADGNGRTGRALIYATLRRTDGLRDYVPPISLVLAAEPKTYVSGFGAYSAGDVSAWCATFADATTRAAAAARRFAEDIERLQREWLERLGNPRSDATVRELVAALPEQPVVDVVAGQRLTGKSHVAVGNAIAQLADAGILVPLNERKWGRAWECDDLLELVDRFERSVATP